MSSGWVLVYIGRRLVAMVLLLVVTSFLVFSLLYVAPGNPVDSLLGLQPRTPETVRALSEKFNLDEPFFTQYGLWAKDAARLDFGTSTQTSLPVMDEVSSRLPVSLLLGLGAFVFTMVVGVWLGVVAALKKRSLIDRGVVAVTIVGLGMPAFVSGVLLMYVFAIVLELFPVSGAGSGVVDRLWHLTLPAIALSLIGIPFVAKHTRAAMINALEQDYVVFARARGLSAREVLFGYALRNAMTGIVTISALTLSFVITGAVIVEVTFSLPGIGSLLVQAANTKDLPMLQGVALVIAAVIMGCNLLADLVYLAVDPRLRVQRQSSA
jgi:peptide/nickel transport system permease protein